MLGHHGIRRMVRLRHGSLLLFRLLRPIRTHSPIKTLGTIQECSIVELEDGSVTWTGHAYIDDDGSDNRHHDPCWQPQTSLHPDGGALDAESVPYIVVPPLILLGVAGVVLGCQAHCRNTINGSECDAVVGDVGPHERIGEMSCECARRLGLSGDPNTGGTEQKSIEYVIFPGQPAICDGVQYSLQPFRT